MTYEKVFETVKKEITAHSASSADGHIAIQVDIVGEGGGAFYIELSNGEIHVEPYDYRDNDCKVSSSADDFISFSKGKLPIDKALNSGKIVAEGNVGKLNVLSEIISTAKPSAKSSKKKK